MFDIFIGYKLDGSAKKMVMHLHRNLYKPGEKSDENGLEDFQDEDCNTNNESDQDDDEEDEDTSSESSDDSDDECISDLRDINDTFEYKGKGLTLLL